MSDHTSVIVQSIPNCDICKMSGVTTPAYADAALTVGTWGNVCIQHFNQYGRGLGLGRGQRLLLDPKVEAERTLSESVNEDEEEDDDEWVDPEVDAAPFASKEHEAAAAYLADLIRKRDAANAKIALKPHERRMWEKKIAKASIIMNTNAMLGKNHDQMKKQAVKR